MNSPVGLSLSCPIHSVPSRRATSIGMCDLIAGGWSCHRGRLLVYSRDPKFASYIRYPHGMFVRENEASALWALMSVISPQAI